MPGPRVLVLDEDKTGGGLHRLISVIVTTRRAEVGREIRPLLLKTDQWPQLFGDLADAYDRWPMILDRLPCLKEIVDTLVAL